MAKEDFDFEKFVATKFNDYKKVTLKDQVLSRSQYGLVLTMVDIGTQKKTGALIPFLKEAEAKAAYEIWMAIKSGKSKFKKATCKAAVVKLDTAKGDNGLDVKLTITKGVKNPKKIETALQPLFTILKKKLTVVGGSEEETTSGTPESSTDGTSTEGSGTPETTVDPAKKAKRAENLQKMSDGVEKLDSVKDKAPKDKLDANIAKYEKALAALIKEAKEDGEIDAEEQAKIDELTNNLNELKSAVAKGDKAPKKLTPERRAKIAANITQISDRLDKILAKLDA